MIIVNVKTMAITAHRRKSAQCEAQMLNRTLSTAHILSISYCNKTTLGEGAGGEDGRPGVNWRVSDEEAVMRSKENCNLV
jgi:hypothetical protein